MAVKVNGQNSFGFWRDGFLDQFWVEAESVGVNVHINWLRAAIGNRPARRDESVGRRDDFVARPDIGEPHGDVQRGGAAVEAERILRAAELREVFFKLRHVRPEAEGAVVERVGERGVNLRADAFDLRGQVEIGDFGCHLSAKITRAVDFEQLKWLRVRHLAHIDKNSLCMIHKNLCQSAPICG